jgi:hypothetical protein
LVVDVDGRAYGECLVRGPTRRYVVDGGAARQPIPDRASRHIK